MRRLRAGEWLSATGGVALLVALALPWYGLGNADVSGYDSLAVIDLLLTLIALLGIALAVLQTTHDTPAMPVGAAVLCVTFGIIGALLVVFRLIDEPESSVLEIRIGAWLALAATIAIIVGGWLSLANEHVPGLPPDVEPELRPTPAP
jgi:hypothetical protein